jgi:hypothetical protein
MADVQTSNVDAKHARDHEILYADRSSKDKKFFSHATDFITLQKPLSSAGFEPANLGSNGKHDNHYTTETKWNVL